MTTVRARSLCHGDVEMNACDVQVVLPDDDRPSYRFLCPQCGAPNEKPADDKIVRILQSAGVETIDVAWEVRRLDDVRTLADMGFA